MTFKIKYISFLLTIIFCHEVSVAQKDKIDSLKNILQTVKEDTNKVNSLNTLSRLIIQKGDYDSAFIYVDAAKVIAGKLHYKAGLANAYNNIGVIDKYLGNYPEALKNHLAALKIREEIGSKQGIAISYNNIGNIYYYLDNFVEALMNHVMSLKIREEIHDTKGIADSYNNIALIYNSQGKFPEALKNYFASLKTKRESGDTLNPSYANTLYNIGIVYEGQKKYPNALRFHFESLKIRTAIKDKYGIASSYINLGMINTRLKKYPEAIKYLNNGLLLSKEIGSADETRDLYNGLSSADSAENNFKKAYEDYRMYIVYRDSLINKEKTKQIVQSQMQFDFDKKEAVTNAEHRKELESQKKIAEEKNRKQKIVIFSIICGLILVIIFAIFILRSLRITRKQKGIIETKSKETEQQKQIIEEKNKDILDSMHYAKRIQTLLLPTDKYIDRTIKRLNKK